MDFWNLDGERATPKEKIGLAFLANSSISAGNKEILSISISIREVENDWSW